MLNEILEKLRSTHTQLIAVSKTKPESAILELYHQGQRAFGENRTMELLDKYKALPKDIEWHHIGHLQRNKVRYIAPFVHLIHAIDSYRLLKEVNKEAQKNQRIIPCLLQFKIAEEESKYGFNWENVQEMLEDSNFPSLENISIQGVMGMATFTDNTDQIRQEFRQLRQFFDQLKTLYFSNSNSFKELSMGMSGDYQIALEEGSTMVRIGTLLFGSRV